MAFSVTFAAEGENVLRRDDVTYSGGNWSNPDSKHRVDIWPQPVGGMKMFLANLDYPESP
jgi:hypothetical protein